MRKSWVISEIRTVIGIIVHIHTDMYITNCNILKVVGSTETSNMLQKIQFILLSINILMYNQSLQGMYKDKIYGHIIDLFSLYLFFY